MNILFKIIKSIFYILLSFIYVFAMCRGICSDGAIILFSLIFAACAIYVSLTHRHIKPDYYGYFSRLSFLNPYLKTGFFVLVLFVCVFMENIYVSAFVIVSMAFITVLLGGVKFKDYAYSMLLPLCFIMLSTITIALNITAEPINELSIKVFGFYIDFGSRYRCVELLFRSMGAISCLYGLSMSTTVADIIQVLYSVKCPKLVVELMFLIYRNKFLLLDILHNMTVSATSRGGYATYKNSYYTYSNIGKNLFLYALKKSNSSFDAMVSRGYEGDLNFCSERVKINAKEIIFCVIYILILTGVSICLK